MENIVFSFLMTTLAGFSTLLGIIPCYLNKTRESIISKSLAFSAGVMLMISLSSLIPESVSLLSLKYSYIFIFIIVFIFVVLGILFSSFIDQKIEERFTSNKLYKLGLISIIALCLHNIPEGISIAVPIYFATGSHKRSFWYTLLSGFSELLGAVLAYLFIARYVNNFILSLILGVTAGIMIHISAYELLPNSLAYKKRKDTILSFLLGVLVMFICEVLL